MIKVSPSTQMEAKTWLRLMGTPSRRSTTVGTRRGQKKPSWRSRPRAVEDTKGTCDRARHAIALPLWTLANWASRARKSNAEGTRCTPRRPSTRAKQPISSRRIIPIGMSVTSSMNNMKGRIVRNNHNNTIWWDSLTNLKCSQATKVRETIVAEEEFNKRDRSYPLK